MLKSLVLTDQLWRGKLTIDFDVNLSCRDLVSAEFDLVV